MKDFTGWDNDPAMQHPITVTVKVPGNPGFTVLVPHGTNLPLTREALDEAVARALRNALSTRTPA